MNVNIKITSNNIRRSMKEKGYTIKNLAAALMISESTLKNYIYGKNLPPMAILLDMVRLFGLERIEDIVSTEVDNEK